MSILASLALISETKAALALFSAGLAGVSVVASDVYSGVKTGLERRQQKKLENQFDGLLDKENGDTVGAIRSTFAMLKTFDAFVASVSQREKKTATIVSSAGFALLFFIVLVFLTAIDFFSGDKSAPVTGWDNAVVVPMLVIGLLFITVSNAGAVLFIKGFGLAQQYLDVIIPVAQDKDNGEMKQSDMLEHDKLSYKEVKVDVERRLMSSMISVLESQRLRDVLAEKRFVTIKAASDKSGEKNPWIESAQNAMRQFQQLQAIKGVLPHVLKQAKEAKEANEAQYCYNIDAIDRVFTLGFKTGELKTLHVRSKTGFKPPREGFLGRFQRQKTIEKWRRDNTHFDVRDRSIYTAY